MTPDRLIAENRRRHELRSRWHYDAAKGCPFDPGRILECGEYLPLSLVADPHYSPSLGRTEADKLRFVHDFEYWALRCVRITDKVTMREIPFVLNAPQRRLVLELESMRRRDLPLRLIMLKARQWGGSTLIQVYFAWIQIIHRRGWNSLICAHIKDTAATIRGMYSRLLASYPEEYWDEECRPEFRPFERMTNTRIIPGRECRVTVCSSEAQEATRGMDCALAHLSEVAFWKDSTLHNPADLIRSVTSGIMRKPLSFVAMESTANGTGNFFHREWLRAEAGKSDKRPFFVPWYEIDIYAEPVADPSALWASLDSYERQLWLDEPGVTLEGINWYHNRRREYEDHRSMMAEFPSRPAEAFTATDMSVFSPAAVERLRAGCRDAAMRGEPYGRRGGSPSDLSAPGFTPSDEGKCEVWAAPRPGAVYVAGVDVGGRSAGADWSVIAVVDTHADSTVPGATAVPEVVAQWRGHIDHDLLAWKAAALAAWYNSALLVIESNSLESDAAATCGEYILDRLSGVYPMLYRRPAPDGAGRARPGFHTNRATKGAIISHLVALVRDGAYTERSSAACDELTQYEHLAGGGFGARRGCHDDMLMARAIALWCATAAPGVCHPLTPADLRYVRSQLPA